MRPSKHLDFPPLDITQQTNPAPIQPIVELPADALPPQQSQQSTLVDPSPSSQEYLGRNYDRHRYPTRFSLSKKSYSMACISKYSYAAGHIAQTPAHIIHLHEHMACPVINLDTGCLLGIPSPHPRPRQIYLG